jgi:hypothetical protein
MVIINIRKNKVSLTIKFYPPWKHFNFEINYILRWQSRKISNCEAHNYDRTLNLIVGIDNSLNRILIHT